MQGRVEINGKIGLRAYHYATNRYDNLEKALKSYMAEQAMLCNYDETLPTAAVAGFVLRVGKGWDMQRSIATDGRREYSAMAIAEIWKGIQLSDELDAAHSAMVSLGVL